MTKTDADEISAHGCQCGRPLGGRRGCGLCIKHPAKATLVCGCGEPIATDRKCGYARDLEALGCPWAYEVCCRECAD